MITGKKIVIISSIDWDFNWQGHQEIANTLAQNGNQVLFIENTGVRMPRWKDAPRLWKRMKMWHRGVRGIRQESENLYVLSPLILPFPYSRLAGKMNRWLLSFAMGHWMKMMHFRQPILWSFLPTRFSLDVIDKVDPEIVIYYCIADFATLTDAPRKVERCEQQLLKRCDIVFVQGEELGKKCRLANPNVHLFPFGADATLFKPLENAQTPSELQSIPKPIIGYVGGVHRHLDFGLLESLARRHPQWTWVLVGQVQTAAAMIERLPNVKLLGPRLHTELPRYIQHFDVCMVPYQLNEYTRTVYPTKINEYLLMGKPVVSTALPEVVAIRNSNPSLLKIGNTVEAFETCLSEALQDGGSEEIRQRIEFGRQNGWETRLEKMNLLIEGKIREKQEFRTIHWISSLKQAYQRSKRKAVTILMAVWLIWAMASYSPLIWWLASPLKLSDAPRRADAIVVFGAGVGETGAPGQNTIERSRYAAELYQARWAPAVIFSSGYIYSYQEAEDMQLIAISSGVPKEAILTERHSANTYENVRFVKQILDQRGWKSILLVSAPYHMRRASLVFRKNAPEVRVRYLPVQKCGFYQKGRQVRIDQMNALAHEALGILYYKWKGYI